MTLGIFTTVLIAWSFEYRFGRDTSFANDVWRYSKRANTSDARIHHYTWRAGHAAGIIIEASMSSVPDETSAVEPPAFLSRQLSHYDSLLEREQAPRSAQSRASGWPMLALHHDIVFSLTDQSVLQRTDLGLFKLNAPVLGEVRLAWLPVWPGFVVDVIIYASGWFVLIATAGWIRNRYRARRGLCIACKYDLRGVEYERCPECGRFV